MTRRVSLLSFLSLSLTFSVIPSAHAASNSSDEELEQMLQQGLKKPDAAPTPAPVAPTPVAPKPAAPAPVAKPVVAPVAKPAAPAPTPAAKSEDIPLESIKAEPRKALKTETDSQTSPTTATATSGTTPATPSGTATGGPAVTSSKEGSGKDGKTPNKKSSVSAAVNADQAALSNANAKPWSILAALSTSVGVGSFVANPNARNPLVSQFLLIEPAYIIRFGTTFAVRLSARQSLAWEFTKPDNNSSRAFEYSDTLLGGSALIYRIPKVDIALWGAFRMPVPISRQSQTATLVTAVLPSIGASRNWSWNVSETWSMNLNLRYDFGMRKNFNRSTVPGYANSADPSKNTSGDVGDAPTVLTRSTDPVTNGTLFRGAANTDFSMSHSAQVSFTPHDLVTVSAWLLITNATRYGIAPNQADQFTSINARPGAGRVDEMRTNLDVTFNVLPYFFVSTGIFTVQPPFRPDNRGLNNPVINVDSAASNFSTIYLQLTGMI